MSFDHHSSILVLNMMRGMSYLPSMGLGRHQHGPSEFMAFPDHDVPFVRIHSHRGQLSIYGAIAQGEGEGFTDSYAV